jgi:hypothetical protein
LFLIRIGHPLPLLSWWFFRVQFSAQQEFRAEKSAEGCYISFLRFSPPCKTDTMPGGRERKHFCYTQTRDAPLEEAG